MKFKIFKKIYGIIEGTNSPFIKAEIYKNISIIYCEHSTEAILHHDFSHIADASLTEKDKKIYEYNFKKALESKKLTKREKEIIENLFPKYSRS